MASDERRNIFAELKTDPYYADQHNFYKVEKWSRNGLHVHALLYAGTDLEKAYEVFRAL